MDGWMERMNYQTYSAMMYPVSVMSRLRRSSIILIDIATGFEYRKAASKKKEQRKSSKKPLVLEAKENEMGLLLKAFFLLLFGVYYKRVPSTITENPSHFNFVL